MFLFVKSLRIFITERLHIIKQLAEGIKHIHDNHFIHNDIKPDNIIKCNDRRIVIIDFGAAIKMNEKRVTGKMTGTRYYMPLKRCFL